VTNCKKYLLARLSKNLKRGSRRKMIKKQSIPNMGLNHDCPTYLIFIKMLSSMRLSPATIMGK